MAPSSAALCNAQHSTNQPSSSTSTSSSSSSSRSAGATCQPCVARRKIDDRHGNLYKYNTHAHGRVGARLRRACSVCVCECVRVCDTMHVVFCTERTRWGGAVPHASNVHRRCRTLRSAHSLEARTCRTQFVCCVRCAMCEMAVLCLTSSSLRLQSYAEVQ